MNGFGVVTVFFVVVLYMFFNVFVGEGDARFENSRQPVVPVSKKSLQAAYCFRIWLFLTPEQKKNCFQTLLSTCSVIIHHFCRYPMNSERSKLFLAFGENQPFLAVSYLVLIVLILANCNEVN